MSELWIVFQAFKERVREAHSSTENSVTPEAFIILRALFPDAAIGNAMKLLEHQSVLKLKSAQDHFYKVEGSHGEEYHIFKELTYCPCPSFKQILVRNNQLMVSDYAVQTSVGCAHRRSPRLNQVHGSGPDGHERTLLF